MSHCKPAVPLSFQAGHLVAAPYRLLGRNRWDRGQCDILLRLLLSNTQENKKDKLYDVKLEQKNQIKSNQINPTKLNCLKEEEEA